jgi:hypothetical protein
LSRQSKPRIAAASRICARRFRWRGGTSYRRRAALEPRRSETLAVEEQQEIVSRSPRLRAEPTGVWSDIMQRLSVELLAIAVLIEVICLVGADRHANPLTVSIESTELWYNPWPAPGDQTLVANKQCGIPSGGCVPADNSQSSTSNGVSAAF